LIRGHLVAKTLSIFCNSSDHACLSASRIRQVSPDCTGLATTRWRHNAERAGSEDRNAQTSHALNGDVQSPPNYGHIWESSTIQFLLQAQRLLLRRVAQQTVFAAQLYICRDLLPDVLVELQEALIGMHQRGEKIRSSAEKNFFNSIGAKRTFVESLKSA
jgi:hypothetical protein